MKLKKITGAIAAGAALALALSACSSGGSGGSNETASEGGAKEIVIGAVQPMTGTASVFGQGVVGSLENEVDKINEAGGIDFAGEKVTLKVRVFDDKGVPESAQNAVREATGAGIQYFVGPFGSATATGAYSLMAQADAVWFLNSANTPGLTEAPNTYRTTMLIDQYDESTLDFLKDHPELKIASMTTDQAHAGLANRTAEFTEDLESQGVSVAVSATHQPGDTDFRAAITNMMAAGTEVYLFRGYPAEQTQFIKQVRELAGPDVWIGAIAGSSSAETRKAFDDTSVLANTLLAGPRAALDTFVAEGHERAIELNEELQPTPGGFAVTTADTMAIITAAFANAKEQTPEAVMAALNELTADELADATIADYLAQDGGLLFNNREVNILPAYVFWDETDGWVVASHS